MEIESRQQLLEVRHSPRSYMCRRLIVAIGYDVAAGVERITSASSRTADAGAQACRYTPEQSVDLATLQHARL